MNMAYAGIGARDTPKPVLEQMKWLGHMLALRGLTLRSGCAIGADMAFEAGCKEANGQMVLRASAQGEQALAHAASFHPNWDACSHFAKHAHARNSLIMLGDMLDDPVRFVICWTDGGGIKGGTGQSLRIAAAHSIPVYNLWYPEHWAAIAGWVQSNA